MLIKVALIRDFGRFALVVHARDGDKEYGRQLIIPASYIFDDKLKHEKWEIEVNIKEENVTDKIKNSSTVRVEERIFVPLRFRIYGTGDVTNDRIAISELLAILNMVANEKGYYLVVE